MINYDISQKTYAPSLQKSVLRFSGLAWNFAVYRSKATCSKVAGLFDWLQIFTTIGIGEQLTPHGSSQQCSSVFWVFKFVAACSPTLWRGKATGCLIIISLYVTLLGSHEVTNPGWMDSCTGWVSTTLARIWVLTDGTVALKPQRCWPSNQWGKPTQYFEWDTSYMWMQETTIKLILQKG